MNEHFRPNRLPSTTQAAEGLPRRRWSVAEIEAMVAKGIISEDERFELIGGEVVPMSPKGARHELVKQALEEYWFPLTAGTPVRLFTETTLRIGEDELREPDFLFVPRALTVEEVTAASALLIVEVADSSLRFDLETKAPMYARLGVREYWVIDAKTLLTTVHRNPSASKYARSDEVKPDVQLVPELAPGLAVTLRDLDL
jgi:Uma2 family endonuclease